MQAIEELHETPVRVLIFWPSVFGEDWIAHLVPFQARQRLFFERAFEEGSPDRSAGVGGEARDRAQMGTHLAFGVSRALLRPRAAIPDLSESLT